MKIKVVQKGVPNGKPKADFCPFWIGDSSGSHK